MLRFNDIADRILEYNPGCDLQLLQRAYVFSAKVHEGQERLSGEPGLGDRRRVLDELKLPQVLVWKDIDEDSSRRFLDRMGRKLAADLRHEHPSVEKVVLGQKNAGELGVSVIAKGFSEGSPEHAVLVEKARALWDVSGKSYAYMAL